MPVIWGSSGQRSTHSLNLAPRSDLFCQHNVKKCFEISFQLILNQRNFTLKAMFLATLEEKKWKAIWQQATLELHMVTSASDSPYSTFVHVRGSSFLKTPTDIFQETVIDPYVCL